MASVRLAVLAIAFAATSLAAQPLELGTLIATPELHPNDLLRVSHGRREITGRLVATSGDSLRLRFAPFRFTVATPLTLGTQLHRATGHASRVRGAAIGAAVGVFAAYSFGLTISEAFDAPARDGFSIAPLLMPYTIPVGATFGALFPGHRWERVRLAPRP
jgi:hypothetical protein